MRVHHDPRRSAVRCPPVSRLRPRLRAAVLALVLTSTLVLALTLVLTAVAVAALPPVAGVVHPDDVPKAPFLPGELAVYGVTWGPLRAGEIALEVRPSSARGADRDVWHFAGRAVSAGMVRALYAVDDRIEGVVDRATFLPRALSIHVDEARERGRREVQYDHARGIAHYRLDQEHRRREGPKTFERRDPIWPHALDVLSGLYRLRMLPMRQAGKTYQLPVHENGKNWNAQITVGRAATIDTPRGRQRAFPLHVRTYLEDKLKTSREITVWIADAPHRAILRFEAELAFGTIVGTLESFRRRTDADVEGLPIPPGIRPEPRLRDHLKSRPVENR